MTQKGVLVTIHSKLFHETYQKIPRYIRNDFEFKIELFENDPFDLRLNTHRLGYELSPYYSFYLLNGYRVIFRFINKSYVVLIAVGPHSIYSEIIDKLFQNLRD